MMPSATLKEIRKGLREGLVLRFDFQTESPRGEEAQIKHRAFRGLIEEAFHLLGAVSSKGRSSGVHH